MSTMSTDRMKYRIIFNIFWPLSISWLFMAVDNPAVTAVISRMSDPEINLAAHGGIVYPIALIIESPIMMMLSVSIALSKDLLNFRRIHKFMMIMCISLTLIHAAICFTPLFYVIVRDLIGAPEALFPYVRIGLILMLPWSGTIGYRRFYQGILIRTGNTKLVTIGTFIRVCTLMSVIFIGYSLRNHIHGVVVGGLALSAGVTMEAVYAGYKGRKIVRTLFDEGDEADVIGWKELIVFCIPLILMHVINLGWMMIGSSAISRMINPIASLAVWPVMSGLITMLKSFGNACNETTLSLIKRNGFFRPLLTSAIFIGLFVSGIYVLLIITPMGRFWFEQFSALTPHLSTMAQKSLPYVFLLPMSNALLNFYQGILLAEKKSQSMLEGLIVFLLGVSIFLGIGLYLQRWEGIYVIMWGMNFGTLVQTIWLRIRTKPFIQKYAAL